mmetsp:Transcript_12130/g.34715  ORF Transcript_12130/g.34715 Transcript_12130/m.34715 type:complete len:699 (-) Transcript_12130:39-2135(-)
MDRYFDATGTAAGNKRKHAGDDQSPVPDPSASSASTTSADDSPAPPRTAQGETKQRKTKQKNFSKLGRRGDPRMHKSVAARLVNGDMPLLKALLVGGFAFPKLDDEGNPRDPSVAKIDDAKVLDTEGVSLAQRKNQLSRRIRIAREKIQEGGGDMSAYTDVLEGTPFAFQRKKSPTKTSVMSEAELKRLLRTTHAQKQMDILMKERPDAMEFASSNQEGSETEADLWAASSHHSHGQYSFFPTNQQLPSSAMVAGLPNSAPEVLDEDPDADLIHPGNSGGNYRRAKDHPMFAQYQASLTGGAHQWGGFGDVMANVAANQKQATSTAGLAALGAVAHAHSAAKSDASKGKSVSGCGGGGGHGSAKTDSLSLAAASMGISPEMIAMIIGQGTKPASASASEKKKDDGIIQEGKKAGNDETADNADSTADKGTKKLAGKSGGSSASVAAPEVDPEQEAAIDEAKIKIALNVYQTEHSTLLKRCLMIAGFDPSRSEECDPLYIQFAERCAQAEHRRLHRLTLCFQGRHVHRLDGRCGHRAVLHHPAGDDRPHVDFIINGKVECFRKVGAIKSADGNETLWPSKFSCDDAGCSDHTSCHHGERGEVDCHKKSHDDVTCGKGKCDKKCSEATKQLGDPSILYLSEKDIEGHDEWKCLSEIDMSNAMDGLLDDSTLGLMALTADPPCRSRSGTMTGDKPSGEDIV